MLQITPTITPIAFGCATERRDELASLHVTFLRCTRPLCTSIASPCRYLCRMCWPNSTTAYRRCRRAEGHASPLHWDRADESVHVDNRIRSDRHFDQPRFRG